MILPIYTYGMPVLRKTAQDITPDYPNLKQLIADMFETMYHSDGVGLAAPQIGKDIRLAVITLDVMKDEFPEYEGFNKAFINPHIVEFDETNVESMTEGCLSVPEYMSPCAVQRESELNTWTKTSMNMMNGLKDSLLALCNMSLTI